MRKIILLSILLFASFVSVVGQDGPPANTPRIDMTVVENATVTLSFMGKQPSTPLWIEHAPGQYTYHQIDNVNWLAFEQVKVTGTELVIHGDLMAFECKNNPDKILTLDVSKSTNLQILWANNNLSIHTLKLNHNMGGLYVMNNSISELDVTQCTNLQFLYCENNKLSQLNVSNNPYLNHLVFFNNKNMSQIDLKNNINLYAIAMFGCNFDACALDDMYTDIPNLQNDDVVGTIYLVDRDNGNPGALTSKTEIAKSKFWDVQDYNNGSPINIVGDGTGCDASSISETDYISILVYPNPVKDMLQVSIPEIRKPEKVSLINMEGNVLYNTVVTVPNFQVYVSKFNRGVYILQVGNNKRKIVIE